MEAINQTETYVPHLGWIQHPEEDDVARFLSEGWYEHLEQAFFWLFLRPGDTVIDCGAHIGLYALLSQRITSPGGHTVAVEPSPEALPFLRSNLAPFGSPAVTVIDRALGSTPGERKLFTGLRSGVAYTSFFAGDQPGDGTPADVMTLDELMGQLSLAGVDLLKIDVEGAEFEVLRGARRSIESGHIPLIMLEFTELNLRRAGLETKDLFEAVESFGYTLHTFDAATQQLVSRAYCGPIWYENLFAVRDIDAVNRRLANADQNCRRIAKDICRRGMICARLPALEQQVEGLTTQLLQVQADHCEIQGTLESRVRNAEQGRTELNAKLSTSERERANWDSKPSLATQGRSQLESRLLAAERERDMTLRDLEEAREQAAAAEVQTKELLATLTEADSSRDNLQKEIDKLTREIEVARALLAEERAHFSIMRFFPTVRQNRRFGARADQRQKPDDALIDAAEPICGPSDTLTASQHRRQVESSSDGDLTLAAPAIGIPPNRSATSAATSQAYAGGPENEVVASTLRCVVERAGLAFVPDLELALASAAQLPKAQWVGVSHVPTTLPNWLTGTSTYGPLATALRSARWDHAKRNCTLLLAFSEDHAALLRQHAVSVEALKHPLPEAPRKWSWEDFRRNQHKQIIQEGWWLMRMHALHLLPNSTYEKAWFTKTAPLLEDAFVTERAHLRNRLIFVDSMDRSVNVYSDWSQSDFDGHLSENIAFAHFYDAVAPAFMLKCIATRTPFLVNALPSVCEYLGASYPFYYSFYQDAIRKAEDFDLVLRTHEYLERRYVELTSNSNTHIAQLDAVLGHLL